MATDPIYDSVFSLSPAEKLHLVQALWDDLADDLETLPVYDWQKAELDRRKAALELDPASGMTWEQAKKVIRGEAND
ncbi:MAG: addiction module protein [Pirellula sp.]|nr:addiction module protein [Pirellula sp.]